MNRGPGHKPREYPHSSGDRNNFPLRKGADKEVFEGGRQHVDPAADTPAPRTQRDDSGSAGRRGS